MDKSTLIGARLVHPWSDIYIYIYAHSFTWMKALHKTSFQGLIQGKDNENTKVSCYNEDITRFGIYNLLFFIPRFDE